MNKYVLAAVLSLVLPSSPALCQTPTPSPSPTPTESPTPEVTPTPTPEETATPTQSPTASPTSVPEPGPYTFFDTDNDGISEVGMVESQNDGSANELVYSFTRSSDGEDDRMEFGKSADIEAHGDYDGDGFWDLATVRDVDGTLVWRTKSIETGEKSEIPFGLRDDIVLAGCDFDSDRISDLAVIRGSDLHIRLSSSGEEQSEAITHFPLATGEIFVALQCADFNGDGDLDLAAVISAPTAGKSLAKIKKKCRKKGGKKCKGGKKKPIETPPNGPRAQSLVVLSVSHEASDAPSDSTELLRRVVPTAEGLVCQDINGDGAEDCGVFRKLNKLLTRISWSLVSESAPVNMDLPKFVDIAPASVRGSDEERHPGLHLLDKNGTVTVLNLDDLSSDSVSPRSDGEKLLKGVNFGFTGSTNPADPSGTCDQMFSAFDGPGGFLFKRSDFHPGVAVVFPGDFKTPFKQVYVMKDGVNEGTFYYAGLGNPEFSPKFKPGNRIHYRFSSSNFSMNAIVVAEAKGTTYCWQLGDPNKRND